MVLERSTIASRRLKKIKIVAGNDRNILIRFLTSLYSHGVREEGGGR